jgi:UDP-N-acetylmuramyl pentapeptide phosphotransferase/UDP-N-acetylglucosamine-1-phosphate transferase
MAIYILVFFASFIIVNICTPVLIKVSLAKNLTDEPGDLRKLHSKHIPTIGGIIIFAGTLFSYTLLLPYIGTHASYAIPKVDLLDSNYLIAALLILFFIGIKDDIIGTAAIYKLMGQLIVGLIIVLMGNIRITGFHGLFGLNELPYWASVFLSVLTYVAIINAINFIDGVDGLAAGIGLIASACFGAWFSLAGNTLSAALAFSLSGALLGFLMFNFSPAKIFMGDSGSLVIGLILSFVGIKLIEYNPDHLPSGIVGLSRPLIVMAALVYPLMDILRIITIRIFKGQSPLGADRNHIHHTLIDLGFNHRQVAVFLYLYTLTVLAITFAVKGMDPTISFLIIGSVALVIIQFPLIIRKTRLKFKAEGIYKEMERQAR